MEVCFLKRHSAELWSSLVFCLVVMYIDEAHSEIQSIILTFLFKRSDLRHQVWDQWGKKLPKSIIELVCASIQVFFTIWRILKACCGTFDSFSSLSKPKWYRIWNNFHTHYSIKWFIWWLIPVLYWLSFKHICLYICVFSTSHLCMKRKQFGQ